MCAYIVCIIYVDYYICVNVTILFIIYLCTTLLFIYVDVIANILYLVNTFLKFVKYPHGNI